MNIYTLLPKDWNPLEAWLKLLDSASSSDGINSLFIQLTVYSAILLLLFAFFFCLRSRVRCAIYRKELKKSRGKLEILLENNKKRQLPLLCEFEHHLVEIPADGATQFQYRRTVDASEIFREDDLAKGICSNRFFQAAPGLLTGLGVLGTFVGLQLGIGALDLHNIDKLQNSIIPLIQGCSVAFATSVWGVICSLAFMVLERTFASIAINQVSNIQQSINNLVPRYVPEEALADMAKSSRDSKSLLGGLAESIGKQLELAVEKLGEDIKDAVVNATREGQAPLAEHSAGLLSTAISEQLVKLEENMVNMTREFSGGLTSVGNELTSQVKSFGPSIETLGGSVDLAAKTVSAAVDRLSNHEQVVEEMRKASLRIKDSAELFNGMNKVIETSSGVNKQAADAQLSAANANRLVAGKFEVIGEKLPEFKEVVEKACASLGNIAGPVEELQSILLRQPELYHQLELNRNESESVRNDRMLQLTGQLSDKIQYAVEEFAKLGSFTEKLETVSGNLDGAGEKLRNFGDSLVAAVHEQQLAMDASKQAAIASNESSQALGAVPEVLGNLIESLDTTAQKLREGSIESAKSADNITDIVEKVQKTVVTTVERLNSHESYVAAIGESADKINEASVRFGSMQKTLEDASEQNRQAIEKQLDVTGLNKEIALKFEKISDNLPELNKTIGDAVRVIATLGAPLADLKAIVENMPEEKRKIVDESGEISRQQAQHVSEMCNILADKMQQAVVEFSKVSNLAEQLGFASTSLQEASSNLGAFGQNILEASLEQKQASQASMQAALASNSTSLALKPLPSAFVEVAESLKRAGKDVSDGADSASKSYRNAIELQQVWQSGVETALQTMRERLKEIITAYGSQVEGQTQRLMLTWTQKVTECLKSYETQIETLEGGIDELQDVISDFKRGR